MALFDLGRLVHPLDHILILALLAAATTSLIVRRRTWRNQWEAATTHAVWMICVGLILSSPHLIVLNPLLPNEFDSDTWYLQVFLGHALMALAAYLYTYDLAGRIDWTPSQRNRFLTSRIVFPSTILTPTTIGAVVCGMNELLTCIVVASLLWALTNNFYLLWIIRRSDNRANCVVNLYLVCVALGVVGLAARLILIRHGGISLQMMPTWRCLVLADLVFTVGATIAWLRKTRWLKCDMWKRIGTGRPL